MLELLTELKSQFQAAKDNQKEEGEKRARKLISKLPHLLCRAAQAGDSEYVVCYFEEIDGGGDPAFLQTVRDWAQRKRLKVRIALREEEGFPLIISGWA